MKETTERTTTLVRIDNTTNHQLNALAVLSGRKKIEIVSIAVKFFFDATPKSRNLYLKK